MFVLEIGSIFLTLREKTTIVSVAIIRVYMYLAVVKLSVKRSVYENFKSTALEPSSIAAFTLCFIIPMANVSN